MLENFQEITKAKPMIAGTSQIEITPEPGIELQGFAVREQPSRDIADSLFLRTLYLEEKETRFIWLVFDLLGFEVSLSDEIRNMVMKSTGIPMEHVFVTTTHTHSGPGTSPLNCCGTYAMGYLEGLKPKILNAVFAAIRSSESCQIHFQEAACRLAVDRQAHKTNLDTDSRIPVFSWRNNNGDFKAVMLSYGMHPVCLRGTMISADWPGYVSRQISESLPGNPITLVMSGACGNVDPPKVGGTYQEMQNMSQIIVGSILDHGFDFPEEKLSTTVCQLQIVTRRLKLPLEGWTEEEINGFADQCLSDSGGIEEFHDHFLQAVQDWRHNMLLQYRQARTSWAEIPVSLLFLENQVLVAVGGEVFSHLGKLVADETFSPYIFGMTNGTIGYLPVRSCYEVNGYESSWSFVFYNRPRLRQGGLERMADSIRQIIRVNCNHT